MISPILPAHDADTIALQLGIFIARQSYHYRVSPTTVVAAIRDALPSQPEGSSSPHAPAAQTDGEALPQAAPSVAPIPEAPKPLPDAPDNLADALSQPAEAKTSEDASGESPSQDGGAVSAVKGANARLESAVGAEPPSSTNQPAAGSHLSEAQRYAFERVRAEFEADPSRTNKEIAHAAKCNMARANAWLKQMRADRAAETTTALAAKVTIRDRVTDAHRAHPDWNATQIAEHLAANLNTVKRALSDAIALEGTATAEPVPAPNPQKPVAPPPPDRISLKGRIQALHSQHPNWTPAMLSKELGVPVDVVLRALGKARQQEAEMVGGEAAQRAHYSAVAKRLGKPS